MRSATSHTKIFTAVLHAHPLLSLRLMTNSAAGGLHSNDSQFGSCPVTADKAPAQRSSFRSGASAQPRSKLQQQLSSAAHTSLSDGVGALQRRNSIGLASSYADAAGMATRTHEATSKDNVLGGWSDEEEDTAGTVCAQLSAAAHAAPIAETSYENADVVLSSCQSVAGLAPDVHCEAAGAYGALATGTEVVGHDDVSIGEVTLRPECLSGVHAACAAYTGSAGVRIHSCVIVWRGCGQPFAR